MTKITDLVDPGSFYTIRPQDLQQELQKIRNAAQAHRVMYNTLRRISELDPNDGAELRHAIELAKSVVVRIDPYEQT